MGVAIRGTGSALPEKILTNQDLEKMVDTTDEWIRQRTGMKIRARAGKSHRKEKRIWTRFRNCRR